MDSETAPKTTSQLEARLSFKTKALKLSIGDSEAFVWAILNPPKPNDALKGAASRYKKMSL
jgi:uncharacterized protein (DUF1778 family)